MLILCGCHDALSLANILRLLALSTGLATQIAMRIVPTTTDTRCQHQHFSYVIASKEIQDCGLAFLMRAYGLSAHRIMNAAAKRQPHERLSACVAGVAGAVVISSQSVGYVV